MFSTWCPMNIDMQISLWSSAVSHVIHLLVIDLTVESAFKIAATCCLSQTTLLQRWDSNENKHSSGTYRITEKGNYWQNTRKLVTEYMLAGIVEWSWIVCNLNKSYTFTWQRESVIAGTTTDEVYGFYLELCLWLILQDICSKYIWTKQFTQSSPGGDAAQRLAQCSTLKPSRR